MHRRLDSVRDVIEELRAGGIVIVVDDRARENEGDLVMAAERATPEAVNFMTTYGRGLVCVAMTGERLDTLRLPLMVNDNTSRYGTAFTVSVDAKHGTTTGVSAHDRAVTIRTLADPSTSIADFLRPGHVFPLRAATGGVLRRPGHTEAAVDLARLAGLQPAGVVCEILDKDGRAARMPYLTALARRHKLKAISIADLIRYRLRHDTFVVRSGSARLPTHYGEFEILVYTNHLDNSTHLALRTGTWDSSTHVVTRIHSE
jgi:3,4-dihydroxy 2-butanone 4-phosphate synthase/GTP cyclohydrolase II